MWIIRNMFNQAELDSYPVARELTGIYLTLRGPNVGGAVRRFDLLPVATRQPMTILLMLHNPNVGGGLPPMAASGPTRMLDWTGYISVAAVTASIGSAFTAAHF
ncbi:hypothetical protein [Pseudomonas sp. 31 R 17]|nr:hypothetical protein [Pseudomonas sp. 31 R 17]